MRILKAYLQYKFTVQMVNEASFFEVTTSRSCQDVNGFHNVTFGPGGKAIISCSVCCSVRARGTWRIITSRCLRSLIGQLSLLLVPNMVLLKMNNHEHRTKQTYESYSFQPLMSFCSKPAFLDCKGRNGGRSYGNGTRSKLNLLANSSLSSPFLSHYRNMRTSSKTINKN